jgi:uncharacterized membrane protein
MKKYRRGLSVCLFVLLLAIPSLMMANSASAISSFLYSWDWTIDKTGDVSALTLAPSQSFIVNYTVTVDGVATQLPTDALSSIDQTVIVTDDYFGALGTIIAFPHTTYTYSLTVGPYNSSGDYTFTNSASFVTNTTDTSKFDSWTVNIHVPSPTPSVPEPFTTLLLGCGLVGLWGVKKKVKN